MRHAASLLVALVATTGCGPATRGAAPAEPAARPASYGAISGTAFWSGPAYGGDRPLHFGSAHEGDWVGAPDAEHVALEDVVVTATAIGAGPGGVNESEGETWPRDTPIECHEGKPCLGAVAVVHADRLAVANYRKTPLSWTLRREERDWLAVEVPARQAEFTVDVKALAPGVYDIVEGVGHDRVGWLHRTSADAAVVGSTQGNCRYSIGLVPGRYRVVAWHPYLSAVEQVVDVQAGKTTHVNAVFTSANVAR
jgi:hypothetical protein